MPEVSRTPKVNRKWTELWLMNALLVEELFYKHFGGGDDQVIVQIWGKKLLKEHAYDTMKKVI